MSFINKQNTIGRGSYLHNCVKYRPPAKGWNESVSKRYIGSQRGANARGVETLKRCPCKSLPICSCWPPLPHYLSGVPIPSCVLIYLF